MRPQWYCDALPLIVGGDTGASGPVLRNRMLSLLHGIFTQRPGAFAVAFPGREQLAVLPPPLTGALRVFASSREDMDWLAENVISQPWFRDYARLSYHGPRCGSPCSRFTTSENRCPVPALRSMKYVILALRAVSMRRLLNSPCSSPS